MDGQLQKYPVWMRRKALCTYCNLAPTDRHPDILKHKLSADSKGQIQIESDTLREWIENGVDTQGRPEMSQPWRDLAIRFDDDSYDPYMGLVGDKDEVEGARTERLRLKLKRMIWQLMESDEFLQKLLDNPAGAIRMMREFGIDMGGGSEEDNFEEALRVMAAKKPSAILEIIGESGRRRLKAALDAYK